MGSPEAYKARNIVDPRDPHGHGAGRVLRRSGQGRQAVEDSVVCAAPAIERREETVDRPPRSRTAFSDVPQYGTEARIV
jgi:hypothetical protein